MANAKKSRREQFLEVMAGKQGQFCLRLPLKVIEHFRHAKDGPSKTLRDLVVGAYVRELQRGK